MWWQWLIIVILSATTGAAIFSWGWNIGVKYGRAENAHEKYIKAMTDDE